MVYFGCFVYVYVYVTFFVCLSWMFCFGLSWLFVYEAGSRVPVDWQLLVGLTLTHITPGFIVMMIVVVMVIHHHHHEDNGDGNDDTHKSS